MMVSPMVKNTTDTKDIFDAALSLPTDRFEVAPGGTTEVAVAVERRGGFAAPIEVAAVDLPPGVSAGPSPTRTSSCGAAPGAPITSASESPYRSRTSSIHQTAIASSPMRIPTCQ